jgi:uncharacterized heparinase superfamily protein
MGKALGIWLQRALRAVHRPPGEIIGRLLQEGRALPDRFRGPPASRLTGAEFARLFGAPDLDGLWQTLAERGFPAIATKSQGEDISNRFPDEARRIEGAWKRLLGGDIQILGLGAAAMAIPPDWHADFAAGQSWPDRYFRDLDLNGFGQPGDVKVPWELSRMQWLIPAGQHYLISGDDDCAEFVRRVLADWIEKNPYCRGVNWGIAMEAAMRLITWRWLFQVFAGSDAWKDETFRLAFLKSLYAHVVFCERYMEDYGAGGNHLVADAAGLVIGGSFFGGAGPAANWTARGWRILARELPRQVGADGVDFEGSSGYHRLVAELYLWAVRCRLADGGELPEGFRERLLKMADFSNAYIRPDGRAPLWGDNDNGRVLPFGGQPVNDHSYLAALIAASLGGNAVPAPSKEATSEIVWALGAGHESGTARVPVSRGFTESGVYIMASGGDHIFIDCAPVGSHGRGGHGHNDCLSFEAYLNGVPVLADSGSYVYSASPEWRNRFRGSSAHNAPMIDDQEANRFLGERELFLLRADAVPEVRDWRVGQNLDRFTGAHSGYRRLAQPVTPVRTIVLDKTGHGLALRDEFEGGGTHKIATTLHFDPGIELARISENQWKLSSASGVFRLIFHSCSAWIANSDASWISDSYGVKAMRPCLCLQWQGALSSIDIGIYPAAGAPPEPFQWLQNLLAENPA